MLEARVNKTDFLVDWLEFTYFCPENYNGLTVFENFLDAFPEFDQNIDDMVLSAKGFLGYSHVLRYNDEYSILYHPDHEEFGVHVTFPAHGLFRLCELFGLKNDFSDFVVVKNLLEDIRSRGCRFTRMDICYDDYDKTFVPRDFGEWYFNGQISTKTLFMEYIHGYSDTFYLGRRGSDRFLRIYEKDKESKGIIDAIRYEFEFRGKYLNMIIDKFILNEEFSVAHLICDMFNIVNQYDTSGSDGAVRIRKMRAGTLEVWDEFIQKLFAKRRFEEPVDLKVDTKKRTVSFKTKYNWLNKQVFPSMYVILECLGEDKVLDILRSSKNRLTEFDKVMISKYKQEVLDIQGDLSFLDKVC